MGVCKPKYLLSFPQEQKETEATAAGTAEADDATPGLNTREEWTLGVEGASQAPQGMEFYRSCHLPEEGE